MAVRWHSRKRFYKLEEKKLSQTFESVSTHPLKGITVTELKKSGPSSVRTDSSTKPNNTIMTTMADPLNVVFEGSDPLSVELPGPQKMSRSESVVSQQSVDMLDETFEPWYMKKPYILSKYTTSEKLSITTSFLSADDKEKVAAKMQATVTDKVKTRLEQLDDFEEGSVKEMLDLNQQEYVKRIEQLNQALIEAWERDQRVKALKIAIQCSKLLADISVIPFYPSKFVLITDILETFGKLVYARLRDKAQFFIAGAKKPVRLADEFTPEEVTDSAKETCKNWFFKIASIRELIPRIYVEIAIIQSYKFINPGEIVLALSRLSKMIQGIGDPLVSIYARCFLYRVGMNVKPSYKDYINDGFRDFLLTYSQLSSDCVHNTLALQRLEMPQYLTLYSPALEWMLQCIAYKANDNTLQQVLDQCSKHGKSALLLNAVMTAFRPEYIADRALQFTELIKQSDDNGLPKHFLQRTLGLCLLIADPSPDNRLPILNEVWKVVMKLNNPDDYISCAEVWIEYVAKHFGKRELNTILGDIIKHMIPDRAYENFYPQLQSILSKILSYVHDFSLLFSLEKFLPYIDLFQKESIKVEVCKMVVEAFLKHHSGQTSDPIIISASMYLCKVMHDSINALSLDDVLRMISSLISGFINSISFGRDFEQQLSFYVEARASFSNLDSVLTTLVHNVNKLAVETALIVKSKHSKKTGAFVRACAAYSFITIPSLVNHMTRLQLYLCSGQAALINQCLSQADAFFKAAISLIPETPKTVDFDGKIRSSEPFLVEYISNLLSALLVVPDNPDQGVLYLVRGLLNAVREYPWDVTLDSKVSVYIRCLEMLSASSQEVYLYDIDRVDSNDNLYGNDPKYIKEVWSLCSTVLSEILAHLKTLNSKDTQKRQSVLSLEVFYVLVITADLHHQDIFNLCTNLWTLANKHGCVTNKQKIQVHQYLKGRCDGDSDEVFQTLIQQMTAQP